MGSRLSLVVGLGLGALVAVGLMAAAVAFVPDPAPPSASPAAAASPTAAPSGAPSSDRGPSPQASPTPTTGPLVGAFHIGRQAPPLVVPQVGGGVIDLAALKGTPVWVNFMGTYCPPCRDEFPLMNGFAVRYADAGLVILAIDVREEEGVVAAFAESLNARFPIGLDIDGAAQEEWQAYFLPVHFWVDAEGIVRDGALGGIGPDVMARGLARILPGIDVEP